MTNRYPLSLNAVNVVCFKIDWEESALNVLLIKRNITPQKNKWSLPGGFVNVDENIEDHVLNDRINGVKKFNINSTPTLIINDKKFDNPNNYKKLKKTIEKLI